VRPALELAACGAREELGGVTRCLREGGALGQLAGVAVGEARGVEAPRGLELRIELTRVREARERAATAGGARPGGRRRRLCG
jgi:hypothetical protein